MALEQEPKARKPMASNVDKTSAPLTSRGRGIQHFLHEVMVELRKTTWPTPKEAWRLTTVVIGVILIIAIYVGVIDAGLSYITEHFKLIK